MNGLFEQASSFAPYAHRDLRVITRHGSEFGDAAGTVLTFPT